MAERQEPDLFEEHDPDCGLAGRVGGRPGHPGRVCDLALLGALERVVEILTVLERNLFDIPPTEIGQTEVVMTLVDGKEAYRYEQEATLEKQR